MEKELTVTDIMKIEGYELNRGCLNLVVSPVSSGKTHYIFEELLANQDLSRVIYLCDTNGLEQAVRHDNKYYDKCKFLTHMDPYQLGNELGFHTSGVLKDNRVTVMTYAQLGKLLGKTPDCIRNIEVIICDEAHNLVKYSNKYDNYEKQELTYIRLIERLKSEVDNRLIAFFTATPNALVDTWKFDDVKCLAYDFRNYPGIKKLKETNILYFNHYRSLINKIVNYNGLKKGYKAVIYTDRISTIKDMEILLNGRGVSTCGIWSPNNVENPMSLETMKVRECIIKSGRIPDNIDVLVFNASYETGINIIDERIELVGINSKEPDTCTQSRGRVRKNIDILYLLDSDVEDTDAIILDQQWINRCLLKDDKKKLAEELQLYDEKGRLKQWNSIQGKLEENGYRIINDNKRINDKMTRYSIITKDK